MMSCLLYIQIRISAALPGSAWLPYSLNTDHDYRLDKTTFEILQPWILLSPFQHFQDYICFHKGQMPTPKGKNLLPDVCIFTSQSSVSCPPLRRGAKI